jgi:hypothetical protein
MKADKFVTQLRKVFVDVQAHKDKGFSKEDIEKLLKSYYATGKPVLSSSVTFKEDPVLDLVQNYDATSLEIGMVTFLEKIEEERDYLSFGKFEIDDLVIKKSTGNILMLGEGKDHVLYPCAQNGDKFLDALLIAANFFEMRSMDDVLYEDQQLTCQLAIECSEIAGGVEYEDFYKMFLGCFE